jgi:hypothetical protein
MTRAIVFVPPVEHMFMYADRCYEHAAANHYDVEGFVMGNWRQAAEILKAGYAEVLLYAREEHLDPHRKPRIERATPDLPTLQPDVQEVSRSMLRRRRPNQLY